MTISAEQIPLLLDEFGLSRTKRDAERMRVAAHRLKGLGATFDATNLIRCASEIESRCLRQGKTPLAQDLVTDLVCQAQILLAELTDYLNDEPVPD